eukprot:TRINITY_DN22175_c0_g1_i1.p1 TRINITY_DN22175_c0_g1~~TRINITY_DN22175_c0_g1_i1.p1  ORF type:complete len:392 (+),score=53.16 TRINITY_DN22175_c0_g1_i1:288-1463(+)
MLPGNIAVHIAPMIDVSNRYFRSFFRILSKNVVLWTEMVKDDAILYNVTDPQKLEWLLGKCDSESKVVFQLGGSDPERLAQAAKVVEDWGYDEINLNVGCPSERVAQKGEISFGAALMLKPELVRDCIAAMQAAVSVPVTVKCRLGVDDFDSPEFTRSFIETVAQSGCKHFYIHARKAWLNGLSPAQNRTIPPLNYERVYWLCSEFPDLSFTLNGGLKTLEEAGNILQCDPPKNLVGFMYGRAALNTPAVFSELDKWHGEDSRRVVDRRDLLTQYADYLDKVLQPGHGVCSHLAIIPPGMCTSSLKPCINLFNGFPGSKLMSKETERLIRDPANRSRGPGHILRQMITLLNQRYPRVMISQFGEIIENYQLLRKKLEPTESVDEEEEECLA